MSRFPRTSGESALSYRTMAKWVKAFNEECQNVSVIHLPGRLSVREEVHALAESLNSDRHHFIRKLSRDTGFAYGCASHSEGTF